MEGKSDENGETKEDAGGGASFADPTEPGVWKRTEDGQKWTLYPADIAEIIFTALASGKGCVEWGCNSTSRKRKRDEASLGCDVITHRIEFDNMKELDVVTKSERDVKIIQAPLSEVNYTPSVDPVETGVWWKHEDGKWYCYPEATEQGIRSAWRKNANYYIIQKGPSMNNPQGEQYILNLHTMKQTDHGTGRKLPIQMISNLCMPDESLSANKDKNLTVISLSRKLLEEAFQRLISREFIILRLAQMVKYPYKVQNVEVNKYLQGHEGSKYTRNEVQRVRRDFQVAIDQIARSVPGCCGQLLRIVRQTTPTLDEAKVPTPNPIAILRHVFYGPPSSKVNSILKNGLDNSLVPKHGDSFRPSSDKFEKLCNIDGLLKLVLFLAVVPSGLSGQSQNAILVSDLTQYLPIAVVTLKGPEEPAHGYKVMGPVEVDSNVQETSDGIPTKSPYQEEPIDESREGGPAEVELKLQGDINSVSRGQPEREKDVPAADFHDFNYFRKESDLAAGQIWALYDDQDGMPRFYSCIAQVSFSPFFVSMHRLNPHHATEETNLWMKSTGLSITTGEFQMAMSSVVKQEVNVFSHKVLDGEGERFVKIYPAKSQVWAIYRIFSEDEQIGSNKILKSEGNEDTYLYDMMEILDDFSEDEVIRTVELIKVQGFKSVFQRSEDHMAIKCFGPSELQRFSHRVPAQRLSGNDAFGIPKGAMELDPASTPVDLMLESSGESK